MTIVEFLTQRIAEDEAEIGAPFGRDEKAGPNGIGWAEVGAISDVLMCGHVRALAECEAKRRIIELWRNAKREAEMSPAPPFRPIFEGRLTIMDAALRALALAYQDHPEYADEWDPRK